jgi:C-terminal peptidase prc
MLNASQSRVPGVILGRVRALIALIVAATGAAASDVSSQTRKLVEEMSEYRAILEAVDFVSREGVAAVAQAQLVQRCLDGWPAKVRTDSSTTTEALLLAFAATPVTALQAATDECLRRIAQSSQMTGDGFMSQLEVATLSRARPATIGAEVRVFGEQLVILSTRNDSPASRSGLKRGDRITTINSATLASAGSAEMFSSYLDGPQGSEVQLELESAGGADPRRTLAIKRERLEPQLVRLAEIEAGLFVSLTPSISYDAIDQWLRMLQPMVVRRGFLHGLILDLRSSSGGDLRFIAAFASLFLGKDTTMLMLQGREGIPPKELRAQLGDVERLSLVVSTSLREALSVVPLAVITGPDTSSGAEMLAAALQYRRRATVVGSQTAGRANIRTVKPLRQGVSLASTYSFVSLTTAFAVLPDGRPLHGVGVTPDIDMPTAPEQDGLPSPRLQVRLIDSNIRASDPPLLAAMQLLRGKGDANVTSSRGQ